MCGRKCDLASFIVMYPGRVIVVASEQEQPRRRPTFVQNTRRDNLRKRVQFWHSKPKVQFTRCHWLNAQGQQGHARDLSIHLNKFPSCSCIHVVKGKVTTQRPTNTTEKVLVEASQNQNLDRNQRVERQEQRGKKVIDNPKTS